METPLSERTLAVLVGGNPTPVAAGALALRAAHTLLVASNETVETAKRIAPLLTTGGCAVQRIEVLDDPNDFDAIQRALCATKADAVLYTGGTKSMSGAAVASWPREARFDALIALKSVLVSGAGGRWELDSELSLEEHLRLHGLTLDMKPVGGYQLWRCERLSHRFNADRSKVDDAASFNPGDEALGQRADRWLGRQLLRAADSLGVDGEVVIDPVLERAGEGRIALGGQPILCRIGGRIVVAAYLQSKNEEISDHKGRLYALAGLARRIAGDHALAFVAGYRDDDAHREHLFGYLRRRLRRGWGAPGAAHSPLGVFPVSEMLEWESDPSSLTDWLSQPA